MSDSPKHVETFADASPIDGQLYYIEDEDRLAYGAGSVVEKVPKMSEIGGGPSGEFDPLGSADAALVEAKTYTDEQIAGLPSGGGGSIGGDVGDVEGAILASDGNGGVTSTPTVFRVADNTLLRFDSGHPLQAYGVLFNAGASASDMFFVASGYPVASVNPAGISLGLCALQAGPTMNVNGRDVNLIRDSEGVWLIAGGMPGNTKAAGGTKQLADGSDSYIKDFSSSELLNLSGATTNTAGNLAPGNSVIKAILLRVNETIAGVTSFTVKIGGNDFVAIGTLSAALDGVSAGATYVLVPATHEDQYVAAPSPVTVECDAVPTAGDIRLTVAYQQFSPPAT